MQTGDGAKLVQWPQSPATTLKTVVDRTGFMVCQDRVRSGQLAMKRYVLSGVEVVTPIPTRGSDHRMHDSTGSARAEDVGICVHA